jgi:hypothetical protein
VNDQPCKNYLLTVESGVVVAVVSVLTAAAVSCCSVVTAASSVFLVPQELVNKIVAEISMIENADSRIFDVFFIFFG